MNINWISAEDKLPPEGELVIAYATTGGIIPYMRLVDGEWVSDFVRWGGSVTHWVPMEPPEN